MRKTPGHEPPRIDAAGCEVQSIETYQYLESRPRSIYRQYRLKGRHILAEVLCRHTVGPEPRTPEELADDSDRPVAAVREAVECSIRNQELLYSERQRTEERLYEAGMLDSVRPPDSSES